MKHHNKIVISNWDIEASVGVYDFEKEAAQSLILGMEIGFMEDKTFISDEIGSTLNYEHIISTIKNCIASRHFNLLETLAETLCSEILLIPTTGWISLKIEKPGVLKGERSGLLGIEVLRTK